MPTPNAAHRLGPWLFAVLFTGCAQGSSDGSELGDGAVVISDAPVTTMDVATDAGLSADSGPADAAAMDAAVPDGASSDVVSAGDGATAVDVPVDTAADVPPADAGTDGGELACTGGLTDCAGACVDTVTDARNCGGCGTACAAGQACAGGHCGCPGTQTSCGGACVDTGTDLAHCGGCGQRCAPPEATPACHGGVCSVGACAAGHADCDGRAANGCEVALAGAGTCGSGVDLGAFCGDVSCGFLCPGTSPRSVQTRTGRGGVWFHARANECSDCIANIEARVTLASPPGVDYDLYVWAPCGTLLGSSTRGAGMVDEVVGSHTDRPLADDSFDYYIEVRYVSGAACTSWTLTVDARGPSATSC